MNNKRIDEVLSKLDAEFDKETLDWLISMYDGESGGFYYAVSSRDNDQFEPDIESVVQANSCMQTLGLVPKDEEGKWLFPDWYKKGTLDFLRSRQDPDDGYFYDPVYKAIAGKEKLERNTGFASGFIKGDLYEKPLYPTPMERILAKKEKGEKVSGSGKNGAAEQDIYDSPENFIKWLEQISSKGSSYGWGSWLASGYGMIKAAGLEDTLVDWLTEKQNKENGTWEKEFDMNAVNGVLKLCGFFNPSTKPYPNLEKYLSAVIDFTKTFEPITAAGNWNPLGSFRQILKNHPNLPDYLQKKVDEGISDMIDNTIVQMRKFRQPDHGFGYLQCGSSEISNSVKVSLGLPEGDVNALALMMLIYNEAYILTDRPRSHPWKQYRDYFWAEMKKKREPYLS